MSDTPVSTEERALTVPELAAWLKVSTWTIYTRLQSGDLPGFRVGKAWRAFPSAVRQKLAEPTDSWERSTRSKAAHRRAVA